MHHILAMPSRHSSPRAADPDAAASLLDSVTPSVSTLPYDEKPLLRLYFWKNRGGFDLFGKNIALGHVAIDIKVPLNWYAHRIARTPPVSADGLPPSYTLY